MKKIFTLLLSIMAFMNANAAVENIKVGGWLESGYVTWTKVAGYKYNVYVSPASSDTWTKLDDALVREYNDYGRADAIGIEAGEYKFKIVPVKDDNEVASEATVSAPFTAQKYNRDGYAHYKLAGGENSGVGAYTNKGVLKKDARVLYVTSANAKTVKMNMEVGSGKTEERIGVQNIIQAYEKGVEKRPLAIRFIGLIHKEDMPELGSSAEGLQVKGKLHEMNLTLEGVGDDATFFGFGMLVRACQSVEIRNIGIMRCMDDCISLDTDNEHIWVHNNDVFYGKAGSGDHAKGDGAIDVKGTLYCTVSGNHFWDTGKSTLNSNGDEVDFVTYHHNWYDHSDSRHPRVRKSQHLHVFNNYYDGNSKYGVGATTGSCIFVEANNFRNCKFPVMISMQGSDLYAGGTVASTDNKTFSSEDGGIIKTYNNIITGATSTYIPYGATTALVKGKLQSVSYMPTTTHFDAYEVSERKGTVPSEVVTLKGGTGYNNFDVEEDFYEYTPDAPADVPSIVTGAYGAGRCGHGDFTWTFSDSEDTNYAVIPELASAIDGYKSSLIGFFGNAIVSGGGDNGGGDDNGGNNGGGDDVKPDNASICHFMDKAPSSNQVTVSGNYSNSKGTVTYDGKDYNLCVKMESATVITITPAEDCNVTLVFGSAETGKKLKIDNTTYTTDANGKYTFAAKGGTTYTLTKGDSINLFLILFESTATGIKDVTTSNIHNNVSYDLQGRKITKSAKGQLIIKNGKKLVAM